MPAASFMNMLFMLSSEAPPAWRSVSLVGWNAKRIASDLWACTFCLDGPLIGPT